MPPNKKRRYKGGYIDRAQALAEASKPCNAIDGLQALPCTGSRTARLFKHKLEKTDDDTILVAMVLNNDISVIALRVPLNVEKISFKKGLGTDSVSGKRKKGAMVIKAGTVLATVLLADGTSNDLRTPIGGQLLELNEELESNPSLLLTNPHSSGYLAIIYPNTELPELSTDGAATSSNSKSVQSANPNVCFAWVKGNCKRGDKCRFEHSNGNNNEEASIDDEIPKDQQQEITPSGTVDASILSTILSPVSNGKDCVVTEKED